MRLDCFRIIVVLLLLLIVFGIYTDKKPEGFYTEIIGGACAITTENMERMIYNLNRSYTKGSSAFQLAVICAVLMTIIAVIKIIIGNGKDEDS